MQLSERILGLNEGGADGWAVFLRARKLADDGHPIVELTIGEHDIRTAAPILQEMHASAMGGHTGYAMVPGTDALRDTVARRTQERTGVKTTRDNVMITPGGQSALFAAHAATLDAGDQGLYISPYYATYPGTIRGVGAEAVAVEARADDAFQPRAAAVAEKANAAKSLLINTPNNPTGVVYGQATLESLAAVCQDNDLWLISDEVYDTQVWEGTHLSPRALPNMVERTLVVGSMSKSHAMTGSRCGWVIGPEAVVEHLTHLATHTTYGVPGFIQDASVFALNQGPELEREIGAPFERRRALAQKALNGQNVVGLIPSQGAMYLMLDIRATGLTGDQFANQLLDDCQIAVMPGESFGRAAAGHVRVAMTVEDAAFGAALESLVAFAEEKARAAA